MVGKVVKEAAEALLKKDTDNLAKFVEDAEGATTAEAAGKIQGLDMSEAARMDRAKGMGFDTSTQLYHGTQANFHAFRGGRSSGGFSYFSKNPEVANEYATGVHGYEGLNETFIINAAFDPAKRDSANLLANYSGIMVAGGATASMAMTDDAYADEDLSGAYIGSHEAASNKQAEDYFSQYRAEVKTPEKPEKPETSNWIEWAGREGAEAAVQAVGGIGDGINEMLSLAKSAADWLDENAVDLGTLADLGIGEQTDEEFQLPTIEETGETGDALVRGIFQFVSGWVTGGRLLKPVKYFSTGTKTATLGKAMTQGAIADFAAFDAHEARLSDLIQQYPSLQNPVTEYLAADEGDTEAEGRMKNALEGLGIGAAMDIAMKGVKMYRATKKIKVERDIVNNELKAKGATPEQLAEANAEIDAMIARTTPTDKVNNLLGDGDDVVDIEDVTDAQMARFDEPVEGMPDKAININLGRIDSPEAVQEALVKTAKAFESEIDESRRGVISLEQTEKLADEMGMTVDQLLKRRQGEAFNAEQAVAARKILASSASRLVELSKLAAGDEGGPGALVAFRQALAIHGAIQRQVSGMTAEAGRALSSFRIMVSSGDVALDTKAIMDAIEAGGGDAHLRDMATKMMTADPKQINRISKELTKPGMKDMFFEVWINGLLSSPATHIVNMVSNGITAVWMIPERHVAAAIGAARGTNSVKFGEGNHMLYGLAEGFKDGMSLAWNTLKTGQPSEARSKMEGAEHRALTAENIGIENQTIAKGVDLLGDWVVRLPGRALMTTDELFKAIGYRMELRAQAYRTAVNEGLKGKEAAQRIQNILSETPAHIKSDAIDMSRYVTYQKDLGEAGKAFMKSVNKTPMAKVVMPFIRTPVNITKFVGERTPLGLMSKSIREDIAGGGAKADLALAKIGLGTMVLGASAALTQEGVITGSGPLNSSVNKVWREQGNQPHSIKFGDTWYSYNRMDPFGMQLGLMADATEIMKYASESEDSDAQQAAIAVALATVKNLTSKTYLSGVSDLFKTLGYVQSNPDKGNEAAQRYFQRLAGSAVPYTSAVAQAERTIDPTLREAHGVVEYIKSRIPGMSADLPPRRDLFGEPVVLEGGLGYDMVSPVYTSTIKDDPIRDEIVANEIPLNRVRRSINGVELSTEQFDRYNLLIAGRNEDGSTTPGIRLTLKEQIAKQMKTSQYKNATTGPEGGKALIIKTVYDRYKEYAKARMQLEFPEIREKLNGLEADRIKKLRGY